MGNIEEIGYNRIMDEDFLTLILIYSYFKRKGKSLSIEDIDKTKTQLFFKISLDSEFSMEKDLISHFEKVNQGLLTQSDLSVILDVVFKVSTQDVIDIQDYIDSKKTNS